MQKTSTDTTKRRRTDTSMFAFVVEAIDEALPADSGTTGYEIYMRGFERFEEFHFKKALAEKRRALEKSLPLIAAVANETVEF